MQFWHHHSCSCLSLLCSEAELRFSGASSLQTFRALELRNGREPEGQRAEQRKTAGFHFCSVYRQLSQSALICGDGLISSNSCTCTSVCARRCATAALYLYFLLFLLHLLPADYCAEDFSFVLGKLALFPPGLIPSRRPGSPYKQLSVCRRLETTNVLKQPE